MRGLKIRLFHVQPVVPAWGAEGFDPYNVGGIASLRVV
jgi:hypothetical protein